MYRYRLSVWSGNVKKLFLLIYVLPASFDSVLLVLLVKYYLCFRNGWKNQGQNTFLNKLWHFLFYFLTWRKNFSYCCAIKSINSLPNHTNCLHLYFLCTNCYFRKPFFCFLIIFCHMSVCMCVYICV